MKNLLISNAPGTIAQSISRVARAFPFPDSLRLVGLSPPGESIPSGAFDEVVTLPDAYSEAGGIDAAWLTGLVVRRPFDLLIPTTDYETVGWSSATFPPSTRVVVSPKATVAAFYDKWETAELCWRIGVPFARSALASRYDGSFARAVAKPRFGGLSRGVIPDYDGSSSLPDSYVIQEWLAPPEFTFAFYVTAAGAVVGPLVMERTLRYGMTAACLVRDDQYAAARVVAERLAGGAGVLGPCNVQCRLAADGSLTPFEVNCRFSGTCGIRADIGFPDVRFALEEHLFGREPAWSRLVAGGGVKRVFEAGSPNAQTWSDLETLLPADALSSPPHGQGRVQSS
jgi:hypothetical protein